jgi:hypothetical protein
MAKSCSRTNRVLRGGIGFMVGGLIAGTVGFVTAAVVGAGKVDAVAAGGDLPSASSVAIWTFLPVVATVAGAGVGTYVGARKPSC